MKKGSQMSEEGAQQELFLGSKTGFLQAVILLAFPFGSLLCTHNASISLGLTKHNTQINQINASPTCFCRKYAVG